VEYQIIAEAYRDLEQASGRLALTARLAGLLGATPADLLPTVRSAPPPAAPRSRWPAACGRPATWARPPTSC
jgi:hypothetical protein